MNWEKIRDDIYYSDGSLRDIFVPHTTKEDWEKWIIYVNEHYYLEWYNAKTDTKKNKIDLDVILEYWNGNVDLCSTAKIFIDQIQINAHFFADNEFENDISPNEFCTIEDHHKLIEYIKELSRLFNKPVYITPENSPEIVLLEAFENEVIYR